MVPFRRTIFSACANAAGVRPAAITDAWSTQEWTHFLDGMPPTVALDRMAAQGQVDEVEQFVGDRHGGMHYRRGYIFISAPNATTPVHFDPEQNLLLQIRGRKEMNVGRFAMRGVT